MMCFQAAFGVYLIIGNLKTQNRLVLRQTVFLAYSFFRLP